MSPDRSGWVSAVEWRRIAALVLLASACQGAPAPPDWPQFLGPNRDGSYVGPHLAVAWPKEGPPVLWKQPVGAGFSGPAVSADRLVVFHRKGDRARVDCLEPRTGKAIWSSEYATDYRDDFGFDEGPRATPSIAEGRVFTFGAEGRLSCWSLEKGDLLWGVDTPRALGSTKGFFGRACCPLVLDGAVILNVGGPGNAGIVAFDAASGRVRWKATSDEASYSSPTVATVWKRPVVFSLTREALVALEPADGHLIFRYPWRPPMQASVTAAVPLILDDTIFISASYGAGARFLRLKERGPEEIWSSDDVLSNHYATSVHHKGFLYGWHGRQETDCELRCVELTSGKVRWSEVGLKAGTVTLAGDELLVLTEQGMLLRATARPEGFKPTDRVQALGYGVRAYPALADGLFFARAKDQLVCLDLTKGP